MRRHLAAALLCLTASLCATAWAQGSASSGQGSTPSGQGGRADGETDAGAAAVCANCGTVTAIRESTRRAGPAWKSTISGATVGGTPGTGGYQDGRSRMPAPTIGAIGPTGSDSGDAFKRSYGFDVHVLMEDGTRKVVHTGSRPALSIGDRVKVAGGQVYLR
jgi:hypothetical protein